MIISGKVIDGGDTTPESLMDVPRKFVFRIETDDGSIINLRYTAFPPSPFGDRQMKGVNLSFHQGKILPGHYLKASGDFDTETNTLVISQEGDFIETSSGKT